MSKLWGGRFSKATNKLVEDFSRSIQFDHKLAQYDCLGSLAHIAVLRKAGLLTAGEHARIAKALREILKTVLAGTFKPEASFEDIHSYIQHLVEQKAGKAGLKLHTCRSRNDQVVLDVKLYCLDQSAATQRALTGLIQSLRKLGQKGAGICVSGYTHLQHAIPVRMDDHLEAYAQMLTRDITRLKNAADNIHLSLGSGAVAGTMIPASAYQDAAKGILPKPLHPPANAMDTVSDRDFVLEILSALSIAGMHLSRLAEDMILWVSKEFDFIDIDDAFCTGSSLMPQKKNPDVLELVRGGAGRLYGNQINVQVMMKGLPLSYNRDMQHDKEPLFDSFEWLQEALAVLTEMFQHVTFKPENIARQLEDECLYATDIADHLVQNGVAFKEAHAIVGRLIQHKLKKNAALTAMTDGELKAFHPSLTPKVLAQIINPKHSVSAKKSIRRPARR